MSKYGDQQYRYQRQLLSKARDLYSMARIYRMAHEKILDARKTRIYDTNAWKNANGYVKAYIGGILDQLWTDHMSTLSWGYVVDGEIMTCDEMRARWPEDWHTRCEHSTSDEPGNGVHFYPADKIGGRKAF